MANSCSAVILCLEAKILLFVQVYQSLDWELQKHVSLRDTLQQCQTWLSNVQEEIQLPAHAPRCLQEALAQVYFYVPLCMYTKVAQ